MMKKIFLLSLIVLIAMTGCNARIPTSAESTKPSISPMTLTSPVFSAGGAIPDVYAYTNCGGQNTSPALNWGEPPAGTKSFAIIMDDPDAKRGTFAHWVIYNIPVTARGLPNAIPAEPNLEDGTFQAMNDINTYGYIGPCPPSGTHRYSFRLYAMDAMPLDSSFSGTKDQRQAYLDAHALGTAELIGTFTKK